MHETERTHPNYLHEQIMFPLSGVAILKHNGHLIPVFSDPADQRRGLDPHQREDRAGLVRRLQPRQVQARQRHPRQQVGNLFFVALSAEW